MKLVSALTRLKKNTKSHRHQKSLNRDQKESKAVSANAEKLAENANSDPAKEGNVHLDRGKEEVEVNTSKNAHGNNTPAAGVVQTSEAEMSVYWAEHYGEPAPRLVRGALRLDGFASANAGHGGGEFTTRPLVLEGRRLVLNYATSAVGTVKAEVRDAAGNVVPGYSLEECEEIYGDELSRPVRWKAHDDLGGVSGKTIRLHFALRDADLYAIHSEP
jgi:hypothetical protein